MWANTCAVRGAPDVNYGPHEAADLSPGFLGRLGFFYGTEKTNVIDPAASQWRVTYVDLQVCKHCGCVFAVKRE